MRTVSFPPVSARRFRLVLTGGSAASALPALAHGVTLPPILRRADAFLVSEFALRIVGRVHCAELKAGFAAALDEWWLDTDPAAAGVAVDPEQVVDLTSAVDGDGVLRWDAPPGRWRILRLGASLTGQTNGPAPPEATGLEVDKLDATKVRRYLATYLDVSTVRCRVIRRCGSMRSSATASSPDRRTSRTGCASGSRRCAGTTRCRGCPTVAGYVVGDASRSDRFLWDYRRTIAELLASEYYGTIVGEAHDRGLTYYAEALEDNRPQLGDDLAMRSHADVPMGAMWAFDPGTGARTRPTWPT